MRIYINFVGCDKYSLEDYLNSKVKRISPSEVVVIVGR